MWYYCIIYLGKCKEMWDSIPQATIIVLHLYVSSAMIGYSTNDDYPNTLSPWPI